MTTGFYNRFLGGWVGAKPKTPAELAAIDAKNREMAAAEHEAKYGERDRRIAELAAQFAAAMPDELRRVVDDRRREAQELRTRCDQVQEELAEVKVRISGARTPAEYEAALDRRQVLQDLLPWLTAKLRTANQAHSDAVGAARASLVPAGRAAHQAAVEVVKVKEAELKAARANVFIVDAAAGKTQSWPWD